MAKRKIIKIDEEKCNGCGLCVPNCAEGALQIVNGKAELVSEVYCDGLGACLGHCPQGAIRIEEREAGPFDEEAVKKHLSKEEKQIDRKVRHAHAHSGCPGAMAMDFRRKSPSKSESASVKIESELRQWPVQINLVSPFAPYLQDADLLICADCVPFAYADFHNDLLKGKTLLVGCPKLDDLEFYQEKITQILKNNGIRSITYAHMEVPCCFGFIEAINSAISASGKNIPFKEIIIDIQGNRL